MFIYTYIIAVAAAATAEGAGGRTGGGAVEAQPPQHRHTHQFLLSRLWTWFPTPALGQVGVDDLAEHDATESVSADLEALDLGLPAIQSALREHTRCGRVVERYITLWAAT